MRGTNLNEPHATPRYPRRRRAVRNHLLRGVQGDRRSPSFPSGFSLAPGGRGSDGEAVCPRELLCGGRRARGPYRRERLPRRALGRCERGEHDRSAELGEAIERGMATVVEHADRLTGYATGLGFSGHVVGEGNDALRALIGAASEFSGPGFLLPTRNGAVFRWCLEHGLRIV